jgi:gamma-glutamylcyclotransferase (GGCT)/AIG2-like uncharacterized protein YtfP
MTTPYRCLLFVYGTLRKSEKYDITKHKPAPLFIDQATVRGHLFDLGHCPGLRLDHEATLVKGEVFAIDCGLLPVLDELERASGEFYRTLTRVDIGDEKFPTCFLYEARNSDWAQRNRITGGDWISYRLSLTSSSSEEFVSTRSEAIFK